MRLKITGVPEHFNYPLFQSIQENPSLNFQWEYSPGGTGEMIEKLENGSCDAAVLLTEGFCKIQSENPKDFIFIDFYISSPLVWGVHCGNQAKIASIKEVEGYPVLISRFYSGSHLMFNVLRDREAWTGETNYKLVQNLNGALDYAKEKSNFLFLWEKYTTEPYCGNAFKRLSELPTPWPAFVLCLHKRALEKAQVSRLKQQFISLKEKCLEILKSTDIEERISAFSKLDREKIQQWKKQTSWYQINEAELEL
ncbi:MAG: hypothetical protein ACPF8V_02880, partial [Luteibaculum sp.]